MTVVVVVGVAIETAHDAQLRSRVADAAHGDVGQGAHSVGGVRLEAHLHFQHRGAAHHSPTEKKQGKDIKFGDHKSTEKE